MELVPPGFESSYKLGRIIGEGNFSIVRECFNINSGKRFAVKCINKNVLNPRDRNNLVQEILILKQLDHPNIIKLHDVFDDMDTCFLVMEYAAGGELFERIIAKEYYTEAEAKQVVQIVAKTLSFCHAKGITHRDLKPENLLYEDERPDARIKIADFGFAKLVTAETNMSTMCGTPGYYAPEIVRKQPVHNVHNDEVKRFCLEADDEAVTLYIWQYDCRCDVWSLGVIVYILLCGFPPFYDENQVEEMRKILHAEYEFVAPYFDSVSNTAKDLIRKMLVVDPTKRLTIQQVLQHPWFFDLNKQPSERHIVLDSVAKNLKEQKRLSTRSKFRAGVGAVIAVKRTQRLLNMRHSLPARQLS